MVPKPNEIGEKHRTKRALKKRHHIRLQRILGAVRAANPALLIFKVANLRNSLSEYDTKKKHHLFVDIILVDL